jgi:dethiobiotin synthetase
VFHVKRRRYFVTGTGTGVGKTFVTAGLARLAVQRGLRVMGFKPIETGCRSGELGEDQRLLVEAAGNWQTGPQRGVYQFERPASPLTAARAEHRTIESAPIQLALEHIAADLVMVEGAGGWRVPITEHLDMAGLARMLELDVVLVGLATLGTINHTLLSIEAIERDQRRLAAIVLSRRPTDELELAHENAREIARRSGHATYVIADERELVPVLESMIR